MGFGAWAIGGVLYSGKEAIGWGPVDDEESQRAIRAAFENGITFFDTADIYGAGHSEEVLGKSLAPIRDKVVIATKFGNTFDRELLQDTGQNASPDYIRRACEASLKRLQTDHIDLYQFHINDYDPALVEPVIEVLETLVEAGKILAYGWSTDFVDRAEAFLKGSHNATVQFQNNVIDSNPDMMAFCDKHGLIGINRGPLAMGLLTGKFTADSLIGKGDVRGVEAPVWISYFKDGKPNVIFLKKIEMIKEVLRSNSRSLTQGALAWLWGSSDCNLPIPGIRTVKQAEENAKAMQFGPLTAEQMAEIDQILNPDN